ncbi:hypothetical protein [Qipengyuania pacifica]|uniref:hypothetical protein n=1 Tax=Qipengyuania pacifica TaxID=2860199 RepID=UPI001C9DFEF4|nr:hypothetical protein [Qipengyuania pacifica]MBY8333154.1 hypothetical protein [Qipengyuania pacifica]
MTPSKIEREGGVPQTFTVEVTQTIEVELDPAKFDDTFMEEFRASFFPFYTLEQHAEHIAQLQARGIIDLDGFLSDLEFVEGYGPVRKMGLKARVTDSDTEVVLP